MRFEMRDPRLEPMGEMRMPLHVGERHPNQPPGLDQTLVIPTFHALQFAEPGLFQMHVYVDERHAGMISFTIRQVAPPPE
jgi:hypothetical protein